MSIYYRQLMVRHYDKRTGSSYSLLLLSLESRFMVSNTSPTRNNGNDDNSNPLETTDYRKASNKPQSKVTRKLNIPNNTSNMRQVSANYSFKYFYNFSQTQHHNKISN